MDRLEILKYLYAINNSTGELKRVEVEEFTYIRNHTLVIAKGRGLITFHGGKPSEKNGFTYYLKPEYINQDHKYKNSRFNTRLKYLEEMRTTYYNRWKEIIEEIKELRNQIPEKIDLDKFIAEDRERIGDYHRLKAVYQKELKEDYNGK